MNYCPGCGMENEDNTKFCAYCGASMQEKKQNNLQSSSENYYQHYQKPYANQPYQEPNPYQQNMYQPPQNMYQQPTPQYTPPVNVYIQNPDQLPPQYRPLSAWAYFGYTLLYNIPFIGFILLIIFALSNDNINRRNHARSYFCIYLIIAIIFLFLAMAGVSLFGALNLS